MMNALHTKRQIVKAAKYIFIQKDHIESLLQMPYEGPFKVLERKENNFHNASGK
jgi:hypothetical protein